MANTLTPSAVLLPTATMRGAPPVMVNKATQTEANSTTMYVIQLIEQINAMAGVPAAYVYQVGGALNFLDKVLAAKAQSMAYSDGFAIVGIVFLLSLLPGYLMKGRR